MNLTRMGVLFVALGAAGGCTAYSTLKPAASIDCNVENAYVLDTTSIPVGNAYTARA
jgi:hypothetical protein